MRKAPMLLSHPALLARPHAVEVVSSTIAVAEPSDIMAVSGEDVAEDCQMVQVQDLIETAQQEIISCKDSEFVCG